MTLQRRMWEWRTRLVIVEEIGRARARRGGPRRGLPACMIANLADGCVTAQASTARPDASAVARVARKRSPEPKLDKLDQLCSSFSAHEPDPTPDRRAPAAVRRPRARRLRRLVGLRRRRREALARRLLDAEGGLRGDHPGLREDARGRRASTFSQSYGNSGDQARAVIAGLPTDVAALSLEPDITKLVEEKLVARRLERDADEGHRHALRRRARRAPRQPEEHQGLGRPRQARRRGADAQPVHLRRRALERHGRLRRADRAGQDRGAGRSTTSSSSSRTSSCRTSPRASRCRTSPAARATS